jgi:hypothetical protein
MRVFQALIPETEERLSFIPSDPFKAGIPTAGCIPTAS